MVTELRSEGTEMHRVLENKKNNLCEPLRVLGVSLCKMSIEEN